jgi:hypothetical protein
MVAAALAVVAIAAGCASEYEGPTRFGERTREILKAQDESKPVARPALSGPEAHRILENYTKSIGQGGAGAALPPKASTQ